MNSLLRHGSLAGLGLLGILWTGSAHAGSFSKDARGTSAAAFLALPADARSAALGGAVTALAGDAAGLNGNPAGLAGVEKREISLSHSPYVEESSYSNALYAQPVGGGVLAVGVSYFSAGRIDRTDDSGAVAGDFSPSDGAGSLGYARRWGGWSLGVAGKYIQTTVVESDSALAVDLGVQAPSLWENRFRWGVSLRNGGGNIQLGNTARPLPLEVALGCAFAPVRGWLGTADLKFPRDNAPLPALGVERHFSPGAEWALAGRAGWNGRPDSSLEDLTGLTLGFGLARKGWGLDYAFSPLGDLGDAHHVTLKLFL
jgi:hypothetical protein